MSSGLQGTCNQTARTVFSIWHVRVFGNNVELNQTFVEFFVFCLGRTLNVLQIEKAKSTLTEGYKSKESVFSLFCAEREV